MPDQPVDESTAEDTCDVSMPGQPPDDVFINAYNVYGGDPQGTGQIWLDMYNTLINVAVVGSNMWTDDEYLAKRVKYMNDLGYKRLPAKFNGAQAACVMYQCSRIVDKRYGREIAGMWKSFALDAIGNGKTIQQAVSKAAWELVYGKLSLMAPYGATKVLVNWTPPMGADHGEK